MVAKTAPCGRCPIDGAAVWQGSMRSTGDGDSGATKKSCLVCNHVVRMVMGAQSTRKATPAGSVELSM